MKSIEALWSILSVGPLGWGCGVVVFETGRVLGGDSNWYYVGEYNVSGQAMSFRAKMASHSPFPPSGGGPRPGEIWEIESHGTISDDGLKITATGVSGDFPNQVFEHHFRRLEELP